MKENEKGITLIALIMTIIISIILVGVTVNVALNGGIMEKAREAASETQKQADKETLQMAMLEFLDNNGRISVTATTFNAKYGSEWIATDNGNGTLNIRNIKSENEYTVNTETGAVTDKTGGSSGRSNGGGNNEPVETVDEDLEKMRTLMLGESRTGRNFQELYAEYEENGLADENLGIVQGDVVAIDFLESGKRLSVRYNNNVYEIEIWRIITDMSGGSPIKKYVVTGVKGNGSDLELMKSYFLGEDGIGIAWNELTSESSGVTGEETFNANTDLNIEAGDITVVSGSLNDDVCCLIFTYNSKYYNTYIDTRDDNSENHKTYEVYESILKTINLDETYVSIFD